MWSDANRASGLNATFREVPFDEALIKLRLKALPSEDQLAATAAGSFQPEVFADRTLGEGNLHFYLTNTRSPDFFLKVTIHELGHAGGLEDSLPGTKSDREAFGLFQTSVMNPYVGDQDEVGNLPAFVTVCDRKAAKDAAGRQ